MKKIIKNLSLLTSVLCSLYFVSANAAFAEAGQASFSFGIVPQQSPAKLLSIWHPILDEIFKNTGIKLEFKTAVDIPAFENALKNAKYDFSYMNPYHYTHFNEMAGYQALVTKAPGKLSGLIVVHKNSPYQTLEDLHGVRMVFPSPAAFAASLITRAELQKRGIVVEVGYVRSHDSVYANVASGFAAAGGGVARTLAATKPDVENELRVIWHSSGFYSHPIASHPRVPDSVNRKIQQAFIALADSEKGKALLAPLRISTFAAVTNTDYDEIRVLDWKDVDGALQ